MLPRIDQGRYVQTMEIGHAIPVLKVAIEYERSRTEQSEFHLTIPVAK